MGKESSPLIRHEEEGKHTGDTERVTSQPMSPQEVDPQQRKEHREIASNEEQPTINPGDRIDESKTLQEKAQQVAVHAPDITGEEIVVPTYFVVDQPDGTQEALHHVKDADAISDMIRQARMDEDGNQVWS